MTDNEEYVYRMNRCALFGIPYDEPVGINMKRQEDGIQCLYCHSGKLVWINGHYECNMCHNVNISCCNGKTCYYE